MRSDCQNRTASLVERAELAQSMRLVRSDICDPARELVGVSAWARESRRGDWSHASDGGGAGGKWGEVCPADEQ
jgi:hypothetical protein